MRKLMMAVMAVAGLGLTAGCQSRSSDVQDKRQDVAEAQNDAAHKDAEAQRDMNKDIAKAEQNAAEKQADAHKDVQDKQHDLAEAEQKQTNDNRLGSNFDTSQRDATGGSGMANVKTEDVKGTIQSASANTIKLIVPDKNNQILQFQVNPQVQVTRDDKPAALTDLKPGDEVRASYHMDANGQMVLHSIDMKKESAQHPGKQKKKK